MAELCQAPAQCAASAVFGNLLCLSHPARLCRMHVADYQDVMAMLLHRICISHRVLCMAPLLLDCPLLFERCT